jgi:hypothetical protein
MMVGNTCTANTKPNFEVSMKPPKMNSEPARQKSSRLTKPEAMAWNTSRPNGTLSTSAANTICSTMPVATSFQLIARRFSENSTAMETSTASPNNPKPIWPSASIMNAFPCEQRASVEQAQRSKQQHRACHGLGAREPGCPCDAKCPNARAGEQHTIGWQLPDSGGPAARALGYGKRSAPAVSCARSIAGALTWHFRVFALFDNRTHRMAPCDPAFSYTCMHCSARRRGHAGFPGGSTRA